MRAVVSKTVAWFERHDHAAFLALFVLLNLGGALLLLVVWAFSIFVPTPVWVVLLGFYFAGPCLRSVTGLRRAASKRSEASALQCCRYRRGSLRALANVALGIPSSSSARLTYVARRRSTGGILN